MDKVLVESTRPRVVLVEALMRVRHGRDLAVGVGPFVRSRGMFARGFSRWDEGVRDLKCHCERCLDHHE